jgi:hypothetical protein
MAHGKAQGLRRCEIVRDMTLRILAWLAAVVLGTSSAAYAQGTRQPAKPVQKPAAKPVPKVKKDPKWTVEFFGGGGFGGGTGGDVSADFPAGASFTTEAGFPSRQVPSWYFGDGARLFNEVRAQFASRFGVTIPQIAPLDPLFADGVSRSGGVTFGARVTRQLSPRYELEFALQHTQGSLTLSDAAETAIEASRASFDEAFRGLLATVPQAGLQVSSSAQLPESVSASQTAITVVLNITLTRAHKPVVPYVSVGLGRVANSAETLSTRLSGNYQFRFFDSNPFNETDTVTVRSTDEDNTTIGVFGGGVVYELSRQQGLRFDVRVHAGSSGLVTELDASPAVSTLTPALALPSNTSPGIQFSNTTTLKTSLSDRISDQTVFTGSGVDMRVHVTVGYFFRF